MKILFISNYYPPYFIGGYEQLCMDVVTGLSLKGHCCHVLTSTHGVDKPVVEGNVHRLFQLEINHGYNYLKRYRVSSSNLRFFLDTLNEIQPDIVFLWNMGGLNKSIILSAEEKCPKVVYFLTDTWILDKYKIRLSNLGKALLQGRSMFSMPKLKEVICSSEHMKHFLQKHGIPLEKAHVIYNGIDLEPYRDLDRNDPGKTTKLLYIGQIERHKGPHTVLYALAEIIQKNPEREITLTIVGTGDDNYTKELKGIASDLHLDAVVDFTGKVQRERLPGILASHTIFIFPSIWEEPFSLTLIMALASGIPVIATLTGGSKEILCPGRNSLAFEPGDSEDLADKMQLLIDDPILCGILATQGKHDAHRFCLPSMIDCIDSLLGEVNSSNR